MYRPDGQITTRLTAEFPPDATSWKYRSEEWTDAKPAETYRLGNRWKQIQQRRRRAVQFQAAILTILLGVVVLLFRGGNLIAAEMYDGSLDMKGPPFVFIDEAPRGLSWCQANTDERCDEILDTPVDEVLP